MLTKTVFPMYPKSQGANKWRNKMHTKFFKLHGLFTGLSTAFPRLLTNLALFSQLTAGFAQLRFKKKLPVFFGHYPKTTEWRLRSFTRFRARGFTIKTSAGCGFQQSARTGIPQKMQHA
jgi:hypothetical protein